MKTMKREDWIGRLVRVDTPDPQKGPRFVRIDRIDAWATLSGLDMVTGQRWSFQPGTHDDEPTLPPWCYLVDEMPARLVKP
jgi:hypothetical protein